MTDREALKQMLESWWVQKVYGTMAPTDKAKMEAELRGEHRPRPSSLFARGFVELCRNHPPDTTPPPPPASSSLFTLYGGFLRTPDGNAETRAREARQRGYRWVACNVGDGHYESWLTIRNYEQAGFTVVPWMRVRTAADVSYLYTVAASWWTPCIVNLEDEAKTTLPPSSVASIMSGRDYAVSAPGWLYNSVDWTPFRDIPVLLQMFTGEIPSLTGQLAACIDHAHQLGINTALPTWQAYATNGVRPEPEPWDGAYSLYCLDDVTDWGMWP
jgi:hypothetical protein